MNKRRKNRRGRIAQLRIYKVRRARVMRLLLRALALAGFAVAYYIVIFIFFDTPYEQDLKESSKMLRSEYEMLKERYDSLEIILTNIEERDRNIFNIMFESSPNSYEKGNENQILAIYESSYNKSTNELIEEFNQRCMGFEQSVTELFESTQRVVLSTKERGSDNDYIPAIQPIANHQLSLLTASFGLRMHPFYRTLQQHSGVDYTVPEGTRVFATANGRVTSYTLSNSPSGKSLVIDHGNGYETYYAHLNKIDLPRNHKVRRGDIIGVSGNTGLSLTPHLHYEVRYNGVAVDPINYMFMELSPSQYSQIIKIAEQGMQSFD